LIEKKSYICLDQKNLNFDAGPFWLCHRYFMKYIFFFF